MLLGVEKGVGSSIMGLVVRKVYVRYILADKE